MSFIALKKTTRTWLDRLSLPERARTAQKRDRLGLAAADPGPRAVVGAGIDWLCLAQDCSTSHDGGVARHYSLIEGWSSSYPETTGYIADTFLNYGVESGRPEIVGRGRRMLDWLVAIQFPDGAFQGGMVDQEPRLPATFDTGQDLIGLAAGAQIDKRYRQAMIRAADWLVRNQDSDGSWRKFETPFAVRGEKVYETHAAIGLFRAAQVEKNRGYLEAATAQVRWALGFQRSNGWFDKCCLTDHQHPLTHTLGYALRGIVEAHLATRNASFLNAACRTADGVLRAFEAGGRLPGRLTADWQPATDWVCLTGTSQIAECLFLLADLTRREDYRCAAESANAYVRKTIAIAGPHEIRGGVKGSFPIDGWYGRWQYLNWACKFTVDANRAELRTRDLYVPTSSY
jgi:hypothetical protein